MYRLGFSSVYAEANIMKRIFPEMFAKMPMPGKDAFPKPAADAPDLRVFMIKGTK